MASSDHILDVLASPIRREILWLTWHDELTAGEIAERFEVSGPTISQHLRVLREAELVALTVDGNFRRYRARQDRLLSLEPYLRHDEVERWVLSESLELVGSEVTSTTSHLARVRVGLFSSSERGTELEIQQPAGTAEEAEFIAIAWADRLANLQQLANGPIDS